LADRIGLKEVINNEKGFVVKKTIKYLYKLWSREEPLENILGLTYGCAVGYCLLLLADSGAKAFIAVSNLIIRTLF
jgi:hypothetical protein